MGTDKWNRTSPDREDIRHPWPPIGGYGLQSGNCLFQVYGKTETTAGWPWRAVDKDQNATKHTYPSGHYRLDILTGN